jgi:hypothetical protein
MAKQPTAADLGGLPSVTGARPVASYDVSPFARGAQEIAEAGKRIGHSIGDVGQAAYEVDRQHAVSAATDASAFIHARLIEARARFRNDPDYATLAQRWDDASGKILDDGVAGIDNARLREHVRSTVGVALARESASIQDQAFRGAADAHATYRDQYLQNLLRNTGLDANDALTTGATDAYHATIDDAVARGFVTPQAARAEKRRGALALCAAHYSVMARADPARAIDELRSPDCPHPVAQFLPAETKNGLIARAAANQEAQRLDTERAPFLRAQQSQRASDEAESAILKDLLGPDPTVAATAIVNDDTLTPAAKDRMVGAAARSMQPDPPATVSNANAVALLDRIRRPDGDAERIRDIGPLIAAYNAGDLGKADLAFTAKQLAEAQTPEGQDLAVRKQAFFRGVGLLLGPANLADARAGNGQPVNRLRLHDFERAVDQKIDRHRSEGKDPLELFDPAKPDYVGKPESLSPFAQGALIETLAERDRQLTSAATASVAGAHRKATSAELAGARDALRQDVDHRAVIDRFNAHAVDFSAL